MRLGGLRHLQDGELGSDAAGPTATSAYQCHRLELDRRVGQRPRCPIQRVLEDAGNGMVVLSAANQEGVRAPNLLTEITHCRWLSIALVNVLVVQRERLDRKDLNDNAVWRNLLGSTQ